MTGKQITKARYKLEMSQRELAKKIGVSPRWLSECECGRQKLGADTWKKVEKMLK